MQPPSDRTAVKRSRDRGVYDADVIHSILDEALICHVGFSTANGWPIVIPTIHARVGDVLYLHGSPASQLMGTTDEVEICVTATIVDGIVAARSAFHHSMNYRSVMVFGKPRRVTDQAERDVAFEAIVNHVIPGRSDEIRGPNEKENKGTRLIAIDISEASAKVRTGPPVDEPEDMDSGIWAGIIPLRTVAGTPEPDPDLEGSLAVPPSISGYRAN